MFFIRPQTFPRYYNVLLAVKSLIDFREQNQLWQYAFQELQIESVDRH